MSSDVQFYRHLLTDIKTRIERAQVRGMLAVNMELLRLTTESFHDEIMAKYAVIQPKAGRAEL